MGLWSNKRVSLLPKRTLGVSGERLSLLPVQKEGAPQTGPKPEREIAAPKPRIRAARSWKRITILSCFGVAGFGFAVALMAGGVYWYSRSPKTPKAWNEKAIQALYVGTKFVEEGKENTLRAELVFDLWNTTGYDFTLEAKPSETMIVMQKVRSEPSLVDGLGLTWTVEHGSGTGQLHADGIPGFSREAFLVGPVFIPAGEAVRVDFWSEYDIFDIVAAIGNDEKIRLSDPAQQRKILKHALADTDSFVLLDKKNHYRIELPLQDAVK
jgi:hypothetical protein